MWNIFNYLGSMTRNEARFLREIKSRNATAKVAFYKKRTRFHQQIGLKFNEETSEIIRSITLYDAETWTVRKVAEKFLGSSEVWCWGKMERITLTDHVKNEEVLHKVKELGISYLQ